MSSTALMLTPAGCSILLPRMTGCTSLLRPPRTPTPISRLTSILSAHFSHENTERVESLSSGHVMIDSTFSWLIDMHGSTGGPAAQVHRFLQVVRAALEHIAGGTLRHHILHVLSRMAPDDAQAPLLPSSAFQKSKGQLVADPVVQASLPHCCRVFLSI